MVVEGYLKYFLSLSISHSVHSLKVLTIKINYMISILSIALVCQVMVYGSFMYLALFYFKVSDASDTWMCHLIKYIGIFSIAGNMTAAYFSVSSDLARFLGILLLISSFVLLWWSVRIHKEVALDFAFTDRKPYRLTVRGPYAIVRHPIYLSYILGWLAGVFISGHIGLISIPIIMSAIYIRAIKSEEERFLESEFSIEYKKYSIEVKRVIPFMY